MTRPLCHARSPYRARGSRGMSDRNFGRTPRGPGRWLLPVCLVIATAGCAASVKLPPRDNGLQWDQVASVCPPPVAVDLGPHYQHVNIGAWHPRPPDPWRWPHFYPDPPHGKIYPPLLPRIAAVGKDTTVRERLIVSYRETFRLPRLRSLDEHQPRNSATNLARLLEAQHIIETIRDQRDSAFRADSIDLSQKFGAKVLHRHWLTQSLLVSMPLAQVVSLARRSSVVYVEPEIGIEEPPSCPSAPHNNTNNDDPIVARQLMQTDAYANLGLDYGSMSLLDSGVWTGHTLFGTAHFGFLGDCVNGDETCRSRGAGTGFEPGDVAHNGGHGTASAGLLIGDGSLGNSFRGALSLKLDSFRVFQWVTDDLGHPHLWLNADAAEHGFEKAMSDVDRVIVANLTSLASDRAAVATSANNAYDLGAVVIAANGDAGSVMSPASAPLVIGVGARDVRNLGQTSQQSLGPANGGRIKPDIQTPTGTETARLMVADCTRTDLLHNHNATSGSTPYAGAAAALTRNLLKSGGDDIEPGNVYAALILAGRHYAPNLNNTEGAGLIELPTGGCEWWGTADLTPQASWFVPIRIDASVADSIEAAIWWPEHPAVDDDGEGVTRHNDLDLYLYPPASSIPAGSSTDATGSVFERATAPVLGRSGNWTLEIRGVSFYDPKVFQQVFWAAAARSQR